MDNIIAPKSWTSNQHYLRALSSDWYRILFEVQDCFQFNTFQFFRNQGFKSVSLPITTNSISSPMGIGSDSLPVKIKLFDIDTYLADSMQFMLEYVCRYHQRGCYYIMPSFRGEAEDSTHLSQFYHAEAEMKGSLEDVIVVVENYLKFICSQLMDECASQIKLVSGSLEHIEEFIHSSASIPIITFDEAVSFLNDEQENFKYVKTGEQVLKSLSRIGEQNLIKRFNGFVWVTEFDHFVVPFYQAFTQDKKKSKSADLLFGLGEVVGAGERHVTGDAVREALRLHQIHNSLYEWYYTLKDVFPLQTSGFGLGTERFYCWLLNHDDVRDCQIVPRSNSILNIP